MSVDENTNFTPVIAADGATTEFHAHETQHSSLEDPITSKYPAAPAQTPAPAASGAPPATTDEGADAYTNTAPSVTTTTVKATDATFSPVRVAMPLVGEQQPIYPSAPIPLLDNGPLLVDDEPYIDDGLDLDQDDDAFGQRDRRVQNWLAQQCRFSLVFGESEQDVLGGLRGNLAGKGKERERALPEREDEDEDRGVDGLGVGARALRRQPSSYLDSPEILDSTPAATTATTAPTTVTRTSSGSSRQQAGSSSQVFGSPAIPGQSPDAPAELERADSPLLGFGCGPETAAHDAAELDLADDVALGTADPLTRPAHNWVRELPRDDGVSASEWGRFAVRLRDEDQPSDEFGEGDREKPLPMLPPPSARTSPVPEEVVNSSEDTTPIADESLGAPAGPFPQERTPSAVPSSLPAASSSLTVSPVSPRLSTFVPRPLSSRRSSTHPSSMYPSAHPSAHPSPMPAMQATPLPPSSPPTRRQSRAALSAFMTPVDFGDDFNAEQGQYPSGLPISPAGNRNTLIASASPNPATAVGAAASGSTPSNTHTLATVRSRSGSVGLRNAVYINSDEVIERLDALLLRSPTQGHHHQNVEDELEDMAIEMDHGLADRTTPDHDAEDGESTDSKSEGRLEAEEMLGELGLGLKGLEDDRLHDMPAVATEAEIQSSFAQVEEIKREEDELESFQPQPLHTLHEYEPESHATDVTSTIMPEAITTGSAVPVIAPVTRSRTSSISLAAAGRLPSGPSPAVLHQMHTRDLSSASSSRRMSPSSPSARLSRSHSQSSPQLHQQTQHAHSLSHIGFSRSGTPSSPSSRSNSNHGHGHTGGVALAYLSGHSSNYSNGSIVIPGIASSINGHSRSSSSILLATPATSLTHVSLPPAEPGATRPTRPPPAPPLDLGPTLNENVTRPIGGSLGLDIIQDEFYGDVLGSEESSQQSYLRHYQDSEKERGYTPEHMEQYDDGAEETFVDTAVQQPGDHPRFDEHGEGEESEQLLMALGLEDRMEEFRGITFPSSPSHREDEPSYVAEPSEYTEDVGLDQDDGHHQYPDRPNMHRSMSRWSLTSSTMGDDAPKDKKEIKKKKSRKSFSSPFAAAQAEALIEGPSTPGAPEGGVALSTTMTKDSSATSPTIGEKKFKRGRLASFISRLSGVSQGGSPNQSGPTTPSSAVPPVPSLPSTPAPYAFGVSSGYGMDLSDILLSNRPVFRQNSSALMPSPDIAESAPKKLNSKQSKEAVIAKHTSRQRSNSAADLLRKMPGAATSQSPAGSSSNLQQLAAVHSPVINAAPELPVVDLRRPGLVKSISTPAIGPSAQRPSLLAKKAPMQIQTQLASQRKGHTIILDESMPPTPSSAATSLIEEDEEDEDYGVETNEQERIRRERESDDRWAAQMQANAAAESAPPPQRQYTESPSYSPSIPAKSPSFLKSSMLGMVASHGLVLDVPPVHGDFDQKRRLRSMSNLSSMNQGVSKSPPASASTTSFALPQKPSAGPAKSIKGSSGFRGFVERMGLGGSSANSTLSPVADTFQSIPSPPPSASFAQSSHSPTTSLSLTGSQSPGVFSPGGLLGKKPPKRKLVISGVAITDTAAYEAVKAWCENFGPVREITRADNGYLYVDFESAATAETVCRVQAQVHIKGAGSVQLSWTSKKRPT